MYCYIYSEHQTHASITNYGNNNFDVMYDGHNIIFSRSINRL